MFPTVFSSWSTKQRSTGWGEFSHPAGVSPGETVMMIDIANTLSIPEPSNVAGESPNSMEDSYNVRPQFDS